MQRLVEHFPGRPTRNRLPICSYKDRGKRFEVTASQVTDLLREVCRANNGKIQYGFEPGEIGTRSIRSGAAMSLAIQGGNSDEKIRILGRWKSLAFLTYIRPQVLEWTGGMASEMARAKQFRDLSESHRPQERPGLTAGRHPTPSVRVDRKPTTRKWQGTEGRGAASAGKPGPVI
jgi:hypothetical protein